MTSRRAIIDITFYIALNVRIFLEIKKLALGQMDHIVATCLLLTSSKNAK